MIMRQVSKNLSLPNSCIFIHGDYRAIWRICQWRLAPEAGILDRSEGSDDVPNTRRVPIMNEPA
jgi:hypothetical protein